MGLHDDHGAGGGEPAHAGEVALKGPDVGLIITSDFFRYKPLFNTPKILPLGSRNFPGFGIFNRRPKQQLCICAEII